MFSNSKQLFLPPNVSQTPFQHHCVSPHGQYHSRCPHKQQRGYPLPSASQPNSRTMAVLPSKIDSDYCSALTRQTQQCGRQRVKRVLQLQRMANRPTSDPALPKKVQCTVDLFASCSSFNLRQLETRPRGYLHRCNDPRLVPSQRLHLSTIQSDRASTSLCHSRLSPEKNQRRDVCVLPFIIVFEVM